MGTAQSSTARTPARKRANARSGAADRTARKANTRGAAAKSPLALSALVPTHEQIAREAYLIWQDHGCPAGQDLTHWLAAEQRLRGSC